MVDNVEHHNKKLSPRDRIQRFVQNDVAVVLDHFLTDVCGKKDVKFKKCCCVGLVFFWFFKKLAI